MIITAIKAQVKNPDRVSVFVDGSYSFSLGYNQLLDLRLVSGREITTTELEQFKQASDYGKLLERSLNYVLIRPRSRKEVVDYLRKKLADPEVAEKVLAYLTDKSYINDKSFAIAWVRSRELTKATSKRKLELELRQKGVDASIITEVLSERAGSDVEAIERLVVKKRKLARYQDEQKLLRYLVGQGFGFDDAKQALAQISEES